MIMDDWWSISELVPAKCASAEFGWRWRDAAWDLPRKSIHRHSNSNQCVHVWIARERGKGESCSEGNYSHWIRVCVRVWSQKKSNVFCVHLSEDKRSRVNEQAFYLRTQKPPRHSPHKSVMKRPHRYTLWQKSCNGPLEGRILISRLIRDATPSLKTWIYGQLKFSKQVMNLRLGTR
jgi:hypothetical protein